MPPQTGSAAVGIVTGRSAFSFGRVCTTGASDLQVGAACEQQGCLHRKRPTSRLGPHLPRGTGPVEGGTDAAACGRSWAVDWAHGQREFSMVHFIKRHKKGKIYSFTTGLLLPICLYSADPNNAIPMSEA